MWHLQLWTTYDNVNNHDEDDNEDDDVGINYDYDDNENDDDYDNDYHDDDANDFGQSSHFLNFIIVIIIIFGIII